MKLVTLNIRNGKSKLKIMLNIHIYKLLKITCINNNYELRFGY